MTDKARRVIRKYIEFVITKIRIIWEQKIFNYGDVKVKYILKHKKKADSLVIVFSACTRHGLKARYNYVKTLNGLSCCNRLYILDDYAKDHRGSYYMGRDFRFNEETAVEELIKKQISELKPEKIIFCGSSKGGYAALNFGIKFDNSYMVIGGPQYFLASYLKNGNEYTLEHILGERTPDKEERLDNYLREKLQNNDKRNTQKIYIHYSDKEHTYEEHIRAMLNDLKSGGYDVFEDVADYVKHSDIAYYFPDFLKKQISDIISR